MRIASTASVRTHGDFGNIPSPCKLAKVYFNHKTIKKIMTEVFVRLTSVIISCMLFLISYREVSE